MSTPARDAWRRPPAGTPLDTTDMTVLYGIAQGKTNREIGRELYLSEDSVKGRTGRLMSKLGARSRAHAVHLGHVAGLLGGAR